MISFVNNKQLILSPSKVSVAEVAHNQPRRRTLVSAAFPTLRGFALRLGGFSKENIFKIISKIFQLIEMTVD